jgi:hypothetical protein
VKKKQQDKNNKKKRTRQKIGRGVRRERNNKNKK